MYLLAHRSLLPYVFIIIIHKYQNIKIYLLSFLQKTTNHKHCQLFKASRHGIERLEIGDKEDDKNPKIITLENCVKITQEPSPANLIHVVTKSCTLTLNTLTDDDLKLWLIALQNVAFKDKSGGALTRHSVIEEDNDLYCTSYSDGIFTIRLLPSDVCAKCHLEAKQYVLHLTATDLQLKLSVDNEHNNGAIIIAKWPYRYIRKYGYRDGKFTFEAGRKCDTGEGVFSLEHTNPQEIFRCMAAKMKSMKNLISGDSIVSLDCGEHQFNAALSMEAGSRSPLPPSPNLHSHSKSDLSQSGHLFRGFLSSNDSLNNSSLNTNANSTTSTSIPLLLSSSSSSSQSINKNIPNKPPRKSMTTIENISTAVTTGQQQKYTKFQNYDIVTPPPTSSSSFNISTENIVKTTSSALSAIVLKPLPSTTIDSIGLTTNNHNFNNNNNNKTIVNLVIANSQTTDGGTNTITTSEKPPELPVRNESKSLLSDSRDYESIQIITNAWLTRGIDDIKHTENVSSNGDENLIEFVRQRNQSKDNISMPLSPKNSNHLNNGIELDRKLSLTPSTITTTTTANITSNKLINIGNYDRLEFFGTTSKTSSDYKTIVTITPPGMNKYSANNYHSSSNDYEIIGGPDIQSCRLADDSHMGYGVIRQTISPSNISTTAIATPAQAILSDDELLDHRKYNGLDYAIVSKPKRV